MSAYSFPTGNSQTASYPGDPNDWTGGSAWSSNDTTAVINSAFSSLGGIFTGVANLVRAVDGQPQPVINNGPQPNPNPNNQGMQGGGISATTVIIGVVLLLLILGAIFLVVKEAK